MLAEIVSPISIQELPKHMELSFFLEQLEDFPKIALFFSVQPTIGHLFWRSRKRVATTGRRSVRFFWIHDGVPSLPPSPPPPPTGWSARQPTCSMNIPPMQSHSNRRKHRVFRRKVKNLCASCAGMELLQHGYVLCLVN